MLVDSGSIVEYDCVVGDHVHIATGARLANTETVGTGAHVGVGATVRQGITIGESAVVGAGAVVIRDVPAGGGRGCACEAQPVSPRPYASPVPSPLEARTGMQAE